MEHSKKTTMLAAGVTLFVATSTNASTSTETVENASLKVFDSNESVTQSVERFEFETGELNTELQTDPLLVNKKALKKNRHHLLEKWKQWLSGGETKKVSS